MKKRISFLKKLTLYFLVISIGTYLQTYWAMGYLSEAPSSSCLYCSFAVDILFISLFSTVFLSLFLILISGIKKLYLRFFVKFSALSSTWFFINYSEFVERESSWSTYLFEEEIQITFMQSFFPILTMSLIVICILNSIFFITKN